MTTAPTATGPITLADVRAALGDTDPTATNAGAVRAILGRGSFATVQKHLDAIRAERVPAAPVAPGAAPDAPTMLIDQVWVAAWTAAQALTLGKLETVTAERDAARDQVATQAQDVATLAKEVDIAETAVSTVTAERDAAVSTLQHEQEQQACVVAQAAQMFADYKAEAEAKIATAAAAAALATRDAQIERQALQNTIDRLTDQASELKSLLARLTPTPTK